MKIGCIGVSDHMEEHLLPSLKLIDNFEVISMSSRSDERGSQLCNKYGVSIFSSWSEIVEDAEIDGIFVAGPPELNSLVIAKCIKFKKPVFSEKPCVSSSSMLKNLLDLPQCSKAKIQIGYNFRFSQMFENIQSLTTKCGNIATLEIEFNANKPQEKIWETKGVLEAFLLAIAVHPLEIASSLLLEECETTFHLTRMRDNQVKLFFEARDLFKSIRVFSGNNSASFEVQLRATYESGDVAITTNRCPHTIRILPSPTTSAYAEQGKNYKIEEFSIQLRDLTRDRSGLGYEAELRDFRNLILDNQKSSAPLQASLRPHTWIEQILKA